MLGKMYLVGGLMAAVALLSAGPASASIAGATAVTHSADASILQSAQYWRWRRDDDDRDRYWRRDRDWRYDGYWRHCRHERHECAERWGWGTWEFRRCVRRHGC